MTIEARQLLAQTPIVDENGQPTMEFLEIMDRLHQRSIALDTFVSALATISDPSGGATIDAEARTAINAILDAAQSF